MYKYEDNVHSIILQAVKKSSNKWCNFYFEAFTHYSKNDMKSTLCRKFVSASDIFLAFEMNVLK